MKLKQIYKPVRAIGSDPHLTIALMTAMSSKQHRTQGFMEIVKTIARKYGVTI
jgi:hypothetical protein